MSPPLFLNIPVANGYVAINVEHLCQIRVDTPVPPMIRPDDPSIKCFVSWRCAGCDRETTACTNDLDSMVRYVRNVLGNPLS